MMRNPNLEYTVYPEGYQIKIDDGTDTFPEPTDIRVRLKGLPIEVIDHRVSRFHVKEYKSIRDLVKQYPDELTYREVWDKFNNQNQSQPLLKNLCQVKRKTDSYLEWVYPEPDPILIIDQEQKNLKKTRPIIFYKDTGETIVWVPKLKSPDKIMGLTPYQIKCHLNNYRLTKHKDKFVIVDGWKMTRFDVYFKEEKEHYKKFRNKFEFI